MPIFNSTSLNIVRFCAWECSRQQSGEISVARMVNAYDYAMSLQHPPTDYDAKVMATIIDPIVNTGGLRLTPVTINNIAIPTPHRGAFNLLFDAWHNLTPNEFYQEFERMHPFRDGNGRLGAIFYNLRGQSMCFPQIPPPFGSNDV